MATDTTQKTEKAEAAEGEPKAEQAETTEEAADGTASPEATEKTADTAPDDRFEDTGDHPQEAGATTAPGNGGLLAGAAAVVSAGLSVVSLTGNPLSQMLRERKQLIGQIETANPAGGGGGDQMTALYSAPWHATAVVNGVFAFLAVVLGALAVAVFAKRHDTRPWVKAVAFGGIVLGVVGLAVAAGMYTDVLAPPPEVPSAPSGVPQ